MSSNFREQDIGVIEFVAAGTGGEFVVVGLLPVFSLILKSFGLVKPHFFINSRASGSVSNFFMGSAWEVVYLFLAVAQSPYIPGLRPLPTA